MVIGVAFLAAVLVAAGTVAAIRRGAEQRVGTTGCPDVGSVPALGEEGPHLLDDVEALVCHDEPVTTSTVVPSTTATPSTTDSPVARSTTVAPPAPGVWRRMASAPGAADGAPVWTGRELVVWSGGSSLKSASGGAAYRPDLDRWREIEQGPLKPRTGHTAVWTGREILYWGGEPADKPVADGAAFNPATGAWRRIASAPHGARMAHEAVWTGKEMVVWGGFERCCPIDSTIHDAAAAAYDPAADRWRRLADVPAPWSGDDGRAITFVDDGDVFVWRRGRLGRLDMRANRWRDLGGPNGKSSICSWTLGPVGRGAVAGGQFLVWYGGCQTEFGAGFDLTRGSWTDLGDPPELTRAVVAGSAVLGLVDHGAVVRFDPALRIWSAPNRAPDGVGWAPTATWTGSELLLWGGYDERGTRREGIAFRPI